MRKKLTNCSEYSWGQSSWRGGGSACEERLRELHSVRKLEREPKSFLPVPEIVKKMHQPSLLWCRAARWEVTDTWGHSDLRGKRGHSSIDKVALRVMHSPFSEVFKTLLNKVPSNLIRRLKKQKVCVQTSWVLLTWRILFYFYCFHGYSSVLLNTQGHRRMKDLWACWNSCWRISFWLQVQKYSTEVVLYWTENSLK